jgi:hypothetical protein
MIMLLPFSSFSKQVFALRKESIEKVGPRVGYETENDHACQR